VGNILYIEDDDVAIKAMSGVIRRTIYSLTLKKSGKDAWDTLINDFNYDIIITELKLKSSNTLGFIKDIRDNPFLAPIPIVIYSKVHDREVIKKLLSLGIQNFLFKPYKDKIILSEIDKATSKNWRISASGSEKKFYKFLDEEINSFNGRNKELDEAMEFLIGKIYAEKAVSERNIVKLIDEIKKVGEAANKAAFASLSDLLNEVINLIKEEKWDKVYNLLLYYPNAQVLQKYRLSYISDTLSSGRHTTDTPNQSDEEVSIEDIGTRYTLEETETHINKIKDFPVMESAAASFQMALDDDDSNLDEIVEMVRTDSGLAASLLRFVNMSDVAPGSNISDIHQAISTLGLQRTKLLATSLKAVPEVSSLFTALKWEEFWMHQIGCAILTEEIAKLLKLPTRIELFYLAGLIQDIGKVLLHEIDRDLYKQAIRKAASGNKSLQYLEREYFGCSHEYVGLIFAKESGLPKSLLDAIKYQFEPELAPENKDLVGALSLANHLCMAYHLGNNGDRPNTSVQHLSQHPGWNALRDWFTPGFSETKFIKAIEEKIKSLKVELNGLAKEQAERRRRARNYKTS
jgi:HD-like signal output (HDOD) protein/CheY-like chemotaxis protein